MIALSFLNIRFWHSIGYLFYVVVLGFLVWASLYGVTASGSQRWVSLYFINIQPSELMKIAIIIFFAKYYHRSQISNVNHLKYLLIPIIILVLPISLVLSQPDLGTSVLIALSGLVVLWLVGLNVKYFFYSIFNFYYFISFCNLFFTTLSKVKNISFF